MTTYFPVLAAETWERVDISMLNASIVALIEPVILN